MIKLKKNYTLKTLAKYGFHKGWETYDNVRIAHRDSNVTCGVDLWIDNKSFYTTRYLDAIFEMIKDGILIKVEVQE